MGEGFFLEWWNVIELNSDGCCTNFMNILKTSELYTLNGWYVRYVDYFNKAVVLYVLGCVFLSLRNKILAHFYYSFCCSSESTTERLEIIPAALTICLHWKEIWIEINHCLILSCERCEFNVINFFLRNWFSTAF